MRCTPAVSSVEWFKNVKTILSGLNLFCLFVSHSCKVILSQKTYIHFLFVFIRTFCI